MTYGYGQILRATQKIAEHARFTRNQETGRVGQWLVLFALFTALNSALRIDWCGTTSPSP
jgi:hypothetical protein